MATPYVSSTTQGVIRAAGSLRRPPRRLTLVCNAMPIQIRVSLTVTFASRRCHEDNWPTGVSCEVPLRRGDRFDFWPRENYRRRCNRWRRRSGGRGFDGGYAAEQFAGYDV